MISNAALKKTIKIFSTSGTIICILSALGIAYGFYFKTIDTQQSQAVIIQEVKKDVVEIKEKINKTDVFQGVSTAEYNAMKEKVTSIEKTVDKMDDKIDKILIQTK